jgi:hypothetical protein
VDNGSGAEYDVLKPQLWNLDSTNSVSLWFSTVAMSAISCGRDSKYSSACVDREDIFEKKQ